MSAQQKKAQSNTLSANPRFMFFERRKRKVHVDGASVLQIN
jgi:hypothetical protein